MLHAQRHRKLTRELENLEADSAGCFIAEEIVPRLGSGAAKRVAIAIIAGTDRMVPFDDVRPGSDRLSLRTGRDGRGLGGHG